MKHTRILIILFLIVVYSSSCTTTDDQQIDQARPDIQSRDLIKISVSTTMADKDILILDEINKKEITIHKLNEGVYIGELKYDEVTFISRVVIYNGKIVKIDVYSERGKMITNECEGLINKVISKQSFAIEIAEKSIRDRMLLATIKMTLLEGEPLGTITDGNITMPAALIYKHLPKYPKESRKQLQSGLVVLQIIVDKDGRPRSVEIQKSSGYIELDKLAIEAARKCVFDPALNYGAKTEMGVLLYYNFILKSK
ncbi:energy transducer TonB [Candidatus Dependentiae bacterium]|nr:energy transducer TonB [Candidatus Dependentiae bacterium]